MANPNGDKGKRWERAVREYLAEVFGRAVRRPHQEGFLDVGDLHLSPFALQCKDEARHTFSSYVDDAEAQAVNAGEPYGAAVVKRRNTGTGRAYVVQSLATFRRVAARLESAEDALRRADHTAYDRHIKEHT